MKVDIKDIKDYAEWFSDLYPEDEECFYWLDKENTEIFDSDSLIDDFGYESNENIERSSYFIKLPLIDCLLLEKEFISSFGLAEIEDEIIKVSKKKDVCYTVAFRIVLEVSEETENAWYDYLEKKMTEICNKWANDNGVEFYKQYDEDRTIDIELIKNSIVYDSESDNDNEPQTTVSFFDKLSCDIIYETDVNDIEKSEPDMSDRFINLSIINETELMKSFFADNSDGEEAGDNNFEEFFYEWLDEKSLEDEFDEYKDEILNEAALKFCKENGIKYKVVTNEPSHIA